MTIDAKYPETHPFLAGKSKGLLIGGKWRQAMSGETFASVNPSTGKVIATIARGGPEDIDTAVQAARKALSGPWGRFSAFDRQTLMLKVAQLIEEKFDELGWLETLDMGAPIARTRMFKRWMLQAFRYYAAQAVGICGSVLENSVPGNFLSYTVKAPLGVVGGIIPWNGPLVTQLWSICPTLASGCTLVLKPAEEAALSALKLAELLMEAGVPEGVVNVVPGPGPTAGAALAAHPDVNKIAFTGSTSTGRRIIEASAGNMKRVAVELGGKSPDIVFADADLNAAVPGAAMACFTNSGQVCYAGTRLFVQRSIADEFVQRVTEFAQQLRVGDSLAEDTQLGPLASKAQMDRVTSYMRVASEEGVNVVSGGKRLGGGLANGFFFPPTVLTDVRNEMRIAREEIFGPVMSVITFEDEADAVRLANDTTYGLGGAVWTRDVGRAHRIAQAVTAGIVWVNCYGVTDPSVGYGGTKMSGYGVKGGPTHIEDYVYSKTVWVNLS